MKKKGAYYNNVYKEIDEKWRKLSDLRLPALKELIEVTLDCLDKVWINDYGYPSNRFSKLISLFTNALWTRLGQHVQKIEPGCRPKLVEVDEIFAYWVNTVKEYKEKIWDKEFPGSVDSPECIQRLKELKEVCQLLDELTSVRKKIDNLENIDEI